MNLTDYLASKAQEYAPFDPKRFKRIYTTFNAYCQDQVPKIQIIGTNGKGSTGRFLTLGLEQAGFKVLHFTSPHLLNFKERFYSQGRIITDAALEKAHQTLQTLPLEPMSYFEYATLLAIVLAQDCDYLVAEAGLGGEFDSTSVLNKRIALIYTPISLDHTERLGHSLKEIATTKLRAMIDLEPHTPILLAHQNRPFLKLAKQMASKYSLKLAPLVPPPSLAIQAYAHKHHYPPFLVDNLQTAISALEILNIDSSLATLKPLDLPGRFEFLTPSIILDVAHNVGGAKALAKALADQRVDLVYNSYQRKDAYGVLKSLKSRVKRVWILEVLDTQMIDRGVLEGFLEQLCIPFAPFSWDTFNPFSGLFVVAGSFSVVRTFIKGYQKYQGHFEGSRGLCAR
ncbi:folylpolyglutamate synthase/dihydrofolate synthase family protein [Helicobacter suis]|uniref:Folylpolyglutamate synthase n=2 Tax=Helicobacter suis TaxID=104628 RepID=E7G456_9HELI|nr:bifunctional folylpolyglutamate synthase/dihydrofolate synthase [Helicobacter suis]EFX41838.1 folylpolyglutamate synthase [Helicobacter suis HS5]EFX42940.1 Folylpolyglutamate synthase / dihydrofolate synthase [Helicobacter suis HS1]BCD48122.1 Folylpolyglutamate synthase FolC [Helicobacter suis]BCD49884.1 Folylpolyglutamate synthase FolC [Helicobacter suis]BCD51647.1 Folylpolyglutamate synthase FolC [Helicobacter suis]